MRIQAADPPLTAVSVLQPTAAQAPPGCGTPPPAATAAGQAEGCTISRPTSGRQAGSETAAGQAAGSSQPVHKQGAGWESERAGQLLRAASHLHLHRQRLWTRMKSAGALPFCMASPCARFTCLHEARHPLKALRLAARGPALRLLPRAAPARLVPPAEEPLEQQAAQGGPHAVAAGLRRGARRAALRGRRAGAACRRRSRERGRQAYRAPLQGITQLALQGRPAHKMQTRCTRWRPHRKEELEQHNHDGGRNNHRRQRLQHRTDKCRAAAATACRCRCRACICTAAAAAAAAGRV